jgi:hypothetical protein
MYQIGYSMSNGKLVIGVLDAYKGTQVFRSPGRMLRLPGMLK